MKACIPPFQEHFTYIKWTQVTCFLRRWLSQLMVLSIRFRCRWGLWPAACVCMKCWVGTYYYFVTFIYLIFPFFLHVWGDSLTYEGGGGSKSLCTNATITGWLGWAMVLGSFQCQGVLLLLHIVGQGPAVLAAMFWTGGLYFLHFSSTLSNVLSFGRWLNMTEIDWFQLLNPQL